MIQLVMNEPQKWKASPNISFTLLKTDVPAGRAEIEIRYKNGADFRRGWVGVGDYASFSEGLIGPKVIQLTAVTDRTAELDLFWAE